jgi:hypothetical protein
VCISVARFKIGRLASPCEQSNESPVSVKGLLYGNALWLNVWATLNIELPF